MNCVIYKGHKKADCYLYLKQAAEAEEEEDFSCLPETLLALLGNLEFVMTLELSSTRKLAQADVDEVIAAIHENGYYLQSPPRPEMINYIENSKL